MSDAGNSNEKKEEKDWKNIISRHLLAWTVLIIFSVWIWSMIKPVLIVSGEEESKGSNKNSTVTTTQIKQQQNNIIDAKKDKQPVAVTTTVPIVTTTVPIVVNGERTKNPIIGSNEKRLKIIVNGLNVRAAPTMGGAVIDALRKNEIVTVLGYKGEWLYVKTVNNKVGFIKADTKYEKPLR